MDRTERKIRIGVFTKPLDNWNSGSGHHLDEVMKALLDLNNLEGNPIDFTFIHYAKSENPIYKRVRDLIVPRNPFVASRMIRNEKFDLVHYAPLTLYAPLWGVRSKKCATVHGIEEVLYPQGYTFLQRFHANYVLPILLRLMDGIATVSETSRMYFIQKYGVNPEKVFITTNGYSKRFQVLPEDPTIKKPFVLHISRYSLRKNPVAIIRGFARFIETTGLDWDLVCAGKEWDGQIACELARAAGIADRYKAPGFISEDDAVHLLNNAQSFLFPSFAEGFGMPNVEAMACGCPVVTSGIFAIPEVVGDAALIIQDPNDFEGIAKALEKLATEPEIKKALVERGLERCKLYNWEKSARSLFTNWLKLL